jgi:hypothetical protein
MLSALITIAGGILAASALIIARRPDAKQVIDRLTPYQGWIGLALFGWGVFDLIHLVRVISFFPHMPILFTVVTLCVVVDLLVGFLLGFGLITKYALSKSPQAMKRGQELRVKLAKYQGAFGLAAICSGVTLLILNVIY